MSRQSALFLAWIIAVVAVIVTLYNSVVDLMPVCTLCWYERIGIYPLVIILGIGAFVDDKRSAVYALPLSLISSVFALYHYMLQWHPQLESIGLCGLGPRCSDISFKYWGFITYPFLSLITSLVISVLLIAALKAKGNQHA